jgi:hypothetical protein
MESRILRAKKIILDIISFNTPVAIVFNLLLIIFLLAVLPAPVLEMSPFKCVFKTIILPAVFLGNCPTTGLFALCNCPACGLLRGVSRLLHGDLAGALALNKLSVIVLLVMIALIIANFTKIAKK